MHDAGGGAKVGRWGAVRLLATRPIVAGETITCAFGGYRRLPVTGAAGHRLGAEAEREADVRSAVSGLAAVVTCASESSWRPVSHARARLSGLARRAGPQHWATVVARAVAFRTGVDCEENLAQLREWLESNEQVGPVNAAAFLRAVLGRDRV